MKYEKIYSIICNLYKTKCGFHLKVCDFDFGLTIFNDAQCAYIGQDHKVVEGFCESISLRSWKTGSYWLHI